MNFVFDTIAAIATPSGKGGIGIIRVSGPKALIIAEKLSKIKLKPRYATFSTLFSSKNTVLDQGLVLYFQSPNSFTGEDVIEFQGHGGPVILDMILDEILNQGARMARPGEFSERAFLNDKLDLIQAEAIADLINSSSRQSALAALNSLQGLFSEIINSILEKLIYLRMYVEAALDFPEEEINFFSDELIFSQLSIIKQKFKEVIKQTRQGRILQEGASVVIIGKPNVGKSSLLNQFTGQDSAIVTDIAGTTRDVLREYIQIDGIPLHVIDTAGIRQSNEIVEKVGIEKAYKEIEKADFILCLIAANEFHEVALNELLKEWKVFDKKIILVKNKIDLTHETPGMGYYKDHEVIHISAKTGEGITQLKKIIKEKIGFEASIEGCFSARRRHIDALKRAYKFILDGEKQLIDNKAGELFAEDLNQAQKALSEITGEFTSDDLLGEIFSNFCIGK